MPRSTKSPSPRDRHDDFLSESDLSSSSSSSEGGSVRTARDNREPYRDEPSETREKGYVNAPALSSSDEESQLEDEEKLIGQMIADKRKKKKTRRLWTMRSLGGPDGAIVSPFYRACLPRLELS
jgi:hypothetical protein